MIMKKEMSYIDSVHRDGAIWNIGVMILLLMFPISVAISFGASPDWGALVMGLIAFLCFTLLEKKGLISLDYDKPLNAPGYEAYPIQGSIALTERGQKVLEMMEFQGITEE